MTEVYYYTHTSVHDEFIALCNPTETAIDLTSYYITDEPWKPSSQQAKLLFPQGMKIAPHSTMFLTQNASDFAKETGWLPDYEYMGDSRADVPQLNTYKTVTLSNTGGLIALKDTTNRTIDLVAYRKTNRTLPEWNGEPITSSGAGVILKRNTDHGIPVDTNSASDWLHARIYGIGQSDFPLNTTTFTGEVTLFVSPDNSYDTITKELRNATRSIDLNLYEFTNPFLCTELVAALERNVSVRLFMEGAPIGGLDDREKYILRTLAEHGGQIRCLVSDAEHHVYARYEYDHAKYLIVDNDTVIVESCNWAKTGVPKNPTFGNREWGIVIRNKEIAEKFSAVFQDDWNPAHSDSYAIDAMNFTISPGFFPDTTVPTGRYDPQFTAKTMQGAFNVTPIFSPDNSEQAILDAITCATRSIYVEQLYIYKDWGQTTSPFVNALVNKSHQGVTVQVILDYNLGYEGTITILNETKQFLEENGVKVKFISTEWSPFTTVHNKGMVIDNTTVLLSSINWNEQSVRKNREAGVLIANQEAAVYYASVFLSDWNLAPSKTHVQGFSWADYKYLLLIAVVVCVTVVLIARDWRKRKWR